MDSGGQRDAGEGGYVSMRTERERRLEARKKEWKRLEKNRHGKVEQGTAGPEEEAATADE